MTTSNAQVNENGSRVAVALLFYVVVGGLLGLLAHNTLSNGLWLAIEVLAFAGVGGLGFLALKRSSGPQALFLTLGLTLFVVAFSLLQASG